MTEQQTWWESLRHFGLVLAPNEVGKLESDHSPDKIPGYVYSHLRREIARYEAGDSTVGEFVIWVLDHICGFPGQGIWKRGNEVEAEYSHILVTGENLKPRHIWLGPLGGTFPVFISNVKTIGQGRGRKIVSDCVQWLRAAQKPFALISNGKQWRLIYAGLDFDAGCEWDTDLWFEEGDAGPQLGALRRLLQPIIFEPEEKGTTSVLLESVQASRRGQSDLSASLGERVRTAVETLVRAHGEVLRPEELDVNGSDIYRAAVRVVMRLVVILFAESRDL